ncbi:glycosyltransferase family 2 protein [Candidatus Avelusimicrobium aviculae]|uniref:glycosyltransferase family 2 protein n=1 Tax=Candidatus Avelusimicrobium aviculae TaxID=3416206 RepID=UPI003D0E0D3F
MKKKISIISSAYNEEENIRELYEQVKSQMALLADKYDYEQIVLDNASTDNTLTELRKVAAQDPRFKVIVNARNFGHIRSPYYGILQCQGDAVIYLASDLQDPPSLIPQFLSKWEEGYKVVLAQKNQSKESWLFFAVRRLYYWLLNLVNDSGAHLLSNCTGFGLYDKCVVAELRKLDEPYPYLRGLVCELGYSLALVPFVQPVRKRGITKNNFYTLYDNAMTGFTNHSKVPLRLAALGGFILGMISFVLALVYLVLKLLYWDYFPMGTAPILLAVLFFSSVQLFFIGIIGEYIGAILTQVLKRPLVIEKERINF